MPDSSVPKPVDRAAAGDARRTTDQIEAEIADHLAASAAHLASQGSSPTEAERTARERFGDIGRVARQCWWIQKGDEVMFRTLSIGMLVIVSVGLFALASAGWRMQDTFAERMDNLNAELAAMNATQRALIGAQAARKLPTIAGHVYLGDPAQPAPKAQIQIGRLPDGKIVRTLQADENGNFRTKPLPAGDYFVMALLQGEGDEYQPYIMGESNLEELHLPFYHIQSRPIYVYPGTADARVELDLAFHYGDLAFELSKPLPNTIEVGNRKTTIGLYLIEKPQELRNLPWAPSASRLAPHWPVIGFVGDSLVYDFSRGVRPGQIRGEDSGRSTSNALTDNSKFHPNTPAGKYTVAVTMYASLYQVGDLADRIEPVRSGKGNVFVTGFVSEPSLGGGSTMANSRTNWSWGPTSKDKNVYLDQHRASSLFRSRMNENELLHVDIVDRVRTTIHIEVPDDFEERIRKVLATEEPRSEEITEAFKMRLAEIKVVSTDPIEDAAGDEE